MSVAPVSIGDVAGVVAALSFAFLVLRLGSLIGKAGKVPVSYTHLTLPTNREV